MQLAQVPRDILLHTLQNVSGIIEHKKDKPILSNILISKEGERLLFSSQGTDAQITAHTNLGLGNDKVTTSISARKILDIVKTLPNAPVTLTLTEKRLFIEAEKARFHVQVMDGQSFPHIQIASAFHSKISLPQHALKTLLNMVTFSIAEQDVRYYLMGLLLRVENQHVMVASTDGHRLTHCQIKTEQDFSAQSIIMPRKTTIELARILEDSDNPIDLYIANNQIKFEFSGMEFVSKLIEGTFPDFKRAIQTISLHHFTLNRQALFFALQRIAVLTNDKFKGITLVFEPGLLKLDCINTQQEEALEELEINYDGEPFRASFNVTYLLDVLSILKCDDVLIGISNAEKPLHLTIPNEDNFNYVVMPMRI